MVDVNNETGRGETSGKGVEEGGGDGITPAAIHCHLEVLITLRYIVCI